MKSCVQFTQIDFFMMLSNLNRLEYVDLQNCSEIACGLIFSILKDVPSVMWFNFEPKFPVRDFEEWKFVMNNFRNVHFGHNFRVCMPHYGNYMRVTCDD